MAWVIRRECQEDAGNWFNFSGIDGRDTIQAATLTLNAQARFSERPPEFFRHAQPWMHFRRIPKYHIYVYSFAAHPTAADPSGSLNFSRVNTAELLITAQQGLGDDGSSYTLFVMAENFNLVRYTGGLGGLAFQG
jgi:hypothetical protein